MSKNKDNRHPIFKKDPQDWMDLLHCRVSVVTKTGIKYTGIVYTVDPVSESIVLIQCLDGYVTCHNASIYVIMKDSVASLTVGRKEGEDIVHKFNSLFRPESELFLTSAQLEARKYKVKSWIEKHRFPVTLEEGSNCLSVAGALIIRPPYSELSCLSTNEIILSRIQGLLKAMPDDVNDWDN